MEIFIQTHRSAETMKLIMYFSSENKISYFNKKELYSELFILGFNVTTGQFKKNN